MQALLIVCLLLSILFMKEKFRKKLKEQAEFTTNMSFFRSEPMVFCRLVLHQEYAFDCLVELGYLGKVHFVQEPDQTQNNKFLNEVQRCDEVNRLIKRLQDEINKTGLHTVYYEDADQYKPRENDLPEIERTVNNLNSELTEVQAYCDSLQQRRFSLYEHKQVLEKVESMLMHNNDVKITSSNSMMQNLIQDNTASPDDDLRLEGTMAEAADTGLIVLTGSIPFQRFSAFELMIWRISRGNALVKYKEFELTDDLVTRFQQRKLKYAFMVAFVGENLRQKILKTCQGFQIVLYPCASSSAGRLNDLQKINVELQYLKQIFEKTCEHKKRILNVALADLFNWRAIIRKMSEVYHQMNLFGVVNDYKHQYIKYLKSDCWIPRRNMKEVRIALIRGSRVAAKGTSTLTFPPLLDERHLNIGEHIKPPTYFVTNKFTHGFQKLIEAYGTASYREANPAPYTIITFPFLFAVMFGDVGHGILMALFAFVLVCREKKIIRSQAESQKSNEIFDMLFAGRYIILLMGIFSIYTGLIYNDTLSKPLNIFGSSWRVANVTHIDVLTSNYTELYPSNPFHYLGVPYIFGLDPIWNSVSLNMIILNNSLKMKMAVILGVFQMMFGLMLSAWNAVFFRSRIDFFLVFVPQIVFLTSLFFYLVFLIFYKWSTFGGHGVGEYSATCGPSILITFINMILLKSSEQPPKGCNEHMYAGQKVVEKILLTLALISVPVLLCGKPLHFMYQHRRIAGIRDPEHQAALRNSTLNSLRRSLIYNISFDQSDPHLRKTEPEENLSEIWIHQGIHTIECVLGSVSHTASYLRLWALSLAHSQLSEVLWKMVLSFGLSKLKYFYNSILVFFSFAAFAVLTVAILVVMEGLSAFLHTLRLHWVEFQSKFYDGLGEIFTPFHFQESKKKDSYSSEA